MEDSHPLPLLGQDIFIPFERLFQNRPCGGRILDSFGIRGRL
ncbi:hypothetical protein NOC27_1459 [Nitrosococcus oceani AFC27]|nr:hypothetical protein NOC27_1459 [Nitrosococcus oceani AFC27]